MVARPRRPLHSKRWWVAQLGIDPIQFGAVIVLNLMIGLMHPPIGLLLFVVSRVWAKYPWDR